MGCIWRSFKSKLVSRVRSIRNKQQLIDLKPSNIQNVSAWMNWVKIKKDQAFKVVHVPLYFRLFFLLWGFVILLFGFILKVQSDKFRELRRSQIPHTTSRKGMVCLTHEMV